MPTIQKLPSSCARCLCSIHVFCLTTFWYLSPSSRQKLLTRHQIISDLSVIQGPSFVFSQYQNVRNIFYVLLEVSLGFCESNQPLLVSNFSDINKHASFPQKFPQFVHLLKPVAFYELLSLLINTSKRVCVNGS